MVSTYPACFFKEKNSYSVIFPDLNYLSTCGETLEEAFSMAIECLAGYLFGLQMSGEDFPKPSVVSGIEINKIEKELEINAEESFVNMVGVDVAEYARIHFEKSVKKTLTIPAWLNNAALEENINFSQVLQEALKKRLFSKGTHQ
ncbi:MAG: type II toxin-antitoxin system HicB family antitoxin [Lachnospiraceae bacterium]